MTPPLAVLTDVKNAIAARSVKDTPGLVRHVTDLFLANADDLGEDEIEVFDSVLNDLVVQIETAARALLALRLAVARNAPIKLMRALALDDEPDVACPVLTHSERLDDATLVAAARLKSQEHLMAISRRPAISEIVSDALVDRGDDLVMLSIAGNPGARWSDTGLERLVTRAKDHADLAARVVRRQDLPRRLYAMLLEGASNIVRARLQAELPGIGREIDRVVESAAAHVAAKHANEARDVGAARERVTRLHEEGQLDDAQIRSFAEDGLVEEVRIALALITELPAEFIDQALKQETGEMLVVIARGSGLSWATVRGILQLPIWAHPATASEIRQCLARYEKLGGATAASILKFYKQKL